MKHLNWNIFYSNTFNYYPLGAVLQCHIVIFVTFQYFQYVHYYFLSHFNKKFVVILFYLAIIQFI